MSDKKMEGIKMIGHAYQIVKPLFQVRSYFYAQICCIAKNYEIANAALYLYENEDPSQSLKMLSQKLHIDNKAEYNIIFPYKHLKFAFNDKNISLFLIRDYLIPFRYYENKQISALQFLEITYGAISCLHNLHIRDIIHGNICLSTCYFIRQKQKKNCKFALNILDTCFFTEEECLEGIQERLFSSEGQFLGQKPSYKDDLESLIYVLVHMISKGKILNIKRFQLEWVTQIQFVRWKSTEFFKEMVKIVPPQLQILIELYNIAKSLQRSEKPSYLKILKKILSEMDNQQRSSKIKQTTIKKTVQKQQYCLIEAVDESQIKVKCKTEKMVSFKRNSAQTSNPLCQKVLQAR